MEEKEKTSVFANWTVRDLSGHRKRVITLAWSSDGRKLASGSADQTIRVWTVEPTSQTSKPSRSDAELKGHTATISYVAWRPGHHDQLASTASGDKSTKLWDVRSGKCTATTATGSGLYVTWCPDGSSYAVMNSENALSFIDTRKAGKIVKTHKFPMEIYEAVWGPAPSQFMLATQKGSVDVVALPHMDVAWSLRGHASTCYCFATDKQFKYMATGGGDALVALWDLASAACIRTWAHMDHPVRSLSVSADAQYVAYATEHGELELLGLETGERLAELRIRAHCCDSVAWNPECSVLAYCDEAPDPNTRDRSAPLGVVGIYAPPPSK